MISLINKWFEDRGYETKSTQSGLWVPIRIQTDMRDFDTIFILDRQYDAYTMLLEIPMALNGLDLGETAYFKETYAFMLTLNRAFQFGRWSISDESIGYDITQYDTLTFDRFLYLYHQLYGQVAMALPYVDAILRTGEGKKDFITKLANGDFER